MSHVVIFAFPGHSHVNPTLEISRALTGIGHRVTYVVHEDHVAQVTATGARAVPYTTDHAHPAGAALTGEDIAALGLAALRHSADRILPLALDAFRDDVPDLVLYDLESFFAARCAARRWGRPTAQVFPYAASNEHFSLATELLDGATGHVQQYIDTVIDRLTAAGEDPETAWSLLAGFDERNIVLLPRELQPLAETFDGRYLFTGHSLATEEPGTGSWHPPAGPGPVWVTLGAGAHDRPGLLEACRTAFADSGRHLVMAVAPGMLPAGPPPAAHTEIIEWTRFRSVMPHVSAVICHSSIGTVLEAIYFGKPVVLITYTPEDRVNGQQVTALGIGRTIPGHQATPESIRAAVEHVTTDPGVRRRVARMRMDMLAAGGPSCAARVVDGWLTAPAVRRPACHRDQQEGNHHGNRAG